ncbi:MAG TPA: ATP-grasp domain-containing protein [Phycisphaerae bacterium]|nr:ATP-grasp domain-containing protein [Phycisphaerae bacterium]
MKPIRTANRRKPDPAPRARRVLALVGDTQVGLWVVRSLGRAALQVFTVCHTEHSLPAHSRYSAGAWRLETIPRGAGFADEIESLARELNVGSIMVISESYHDALIRCRDRFEPDIHVFSPAAECFAKAIDKGYMNKTAQRLGVPVARGTTLDRLMSGTSRPSLQFPLVLRTRNQNTVDDTAPWKAAYAESDRDLERICESVKDIASNVLVQQYHAGVEDHVQVLMHQGEPFMVGEYIGEHHMPLAGGVTVQRITCRHDDVIRDAVRLLRAIGWEGIGGIQFHYDPESGRYIFLEINPRFIGGLPTVIMAGFDAPFLLWQSHFEPDRMRRRCYRLGLRTRVLGGDANWMFGMIRRDPLPPGQTHLGRLSAVARFLWNFGPWTRDDVFSLADPRPFWVDWRQMVRKLGRREVDLIGEPEADKETQ